MIVCNSRTLGSLCLGDALERYGESRRLSKSNGCRFEGCAAEEPSTQRLWATRLSARLEERYGHNGCKVDDGSISPQGMPSRTLVAHRPTRMIHPRTTSDSRAASPKPIAPMANAWFRRKVRHLWVGVAACNGTLWLARQPIQVSAARHESVERPIRILSAHSDYKRADLATDPGASAAPAAT